MRETPRTDAFLRAENCVRGNPVAFDWAIGHARHLERDLASTSETLWEALKRCERLARNIRDVEMSKKEFAEITQLRKEYAAGVHPDGVGESRGRESVSGKAETVNPPAPVSSVDAAPQCTCPALQCTIHGFSLRPSVPASSAMCTHEIWEREIAITDGMCPICLARQLDATRAENKLLRKDAEIGKLAIEARRLEQDYSTPNHKQHWLKAEKALQAASDAALSDREKKS